MPQIEAEGDCEQSESEKCPEWRTVLKHDATVTYTVKGADSDVRSICEQAKTGEECRDVASQGAAMRNEPPDDRRDDAAEDWAKPNNERRVGIRENVGTGDRHWMQHNTFDRSASGQYTDDVAELVDGHHCEPAQRQERGDENELVKTLHKRKTGRVTEGLYDTALNEAIDA